MKTIVKNGEDTLVEWNVGDKEDVADIEIAVFEEILILEDGTTKETPRRYEKQFEWNDEWTSYKFDPNQRPEPKDEQKLDSWKNYKKFINEWNSLVAKRKVPIWYQFDPEKTDNSEAHKGSMESITEWKVMYDFLKKEKWLERDAEQTEDKKNKYTEKSQFVVDCSQLLGIGGEAVVIRKSVAEKVGKDKDKFKDREYEALKIIPMMKHNFESEKLEEMKQRVEDRHNKANPEFNKDFIEREKRRKLINSENQDRKG